MLAPTIVLMGLAWAAGEPGSCASDEVELLQRDIAVARPGHKTLDTAGGSSPGLTAQCATPYGSFLGAPLTATQLQKNASNDPLSFDNFEHYPGAPWSAAVHQGGLFVLVDQKFAMCQVPKVASSEWLTVLSKVFLNNASQNDKDVAIGAMMPLSEPWMAQAVFSDPNAVRVVFVRETLSRVRSSFMSRCVDIAADPSTDEGGCPMSNGVNMMKLTMKDVVEWVVKADLSSPSTNAHWMPQSEFCELRDRISEYNVIGLYNKDLLWKDSTCVMDMAGFSEFNTLGPEYDDAPFWAPVDEKFDISGGVSATSSDSAAEIEELKKLFTKEAGRAVLKAYESEIKLFNFPPEPEWLKDATGELYETPLSELV